MKDLKGVIRNIPWFQIDPDPDQPRKEFDIYDLYELGFSILQEGLLQPISVRPHPHGHNSYMIIAGERRWRAHRLISELSCGQKMQTIRARVLRVGEEQARRLSLLENIVRANLKPSEEVKGYQALLDGGMDMEAVSGAVGRPEGYVRRMLKLLDLETPYMTEVDEGRLSKAVALTLADLPPGIRGLAYRKSLGMTADKAIKTIEAINARMQGEVDIFTQSREEAGITNAVIKKTRGEVKNFIRGGLAFGEINRTALAYALASDGLLDGLEAVYKSIGDVLAEQVKFRAAQKAKAEDVWNRPLMGEEREEYLEVVA